jgi:sulfite reductase beta subunit-like hemoprotein
MVKYERCGREAAGYSGAEEVEYLGVVAGEGQVHMDPVNMNKAAEWLRSRCKHGVQVFARFHNFYRLFNYRFNKTTQPLHILIGDWKMEKLLSNKLKIAKRHSTNSSHSLQSASTLSKSNSNDKFRLECNASEYALGDILSQQQNKWKPIAFIPKAFLPTQ